MNSQKISFNAIRKALSEIQDPGLQKDLVTGGAVKDLKIQDNKVSFSLQLSVSGQHAENTRRRCVERLSTLEGVREVEIALVGQDASVSNARSAHIPDPRAQKVLAGIKHIIAVASGKGGVGKSTVAVNLAVALSQKGHQVGLLDADIYGPSIPLMMGASGEQAENQSDTVIPLVRHGIKLMSIGFFLPPDTPVIWRGPKVHSVLTQFISHVAWGKLDFLIIDVPPGTGDIQLTLSQNIPLSGAVIVTTPQDISLIDARKGLHMFQKVNVPILGIVENMSGYICSHCHKMTPIFKQGGALSLAHEMDIPLLGSIPLDPAITVGGDNGVPVMLEKADSLAGQAYYQVNQAMLERLVAFQCKPQ